MHFALEESKRSYSNMGADYSVTDIIKPPKIVLLTKRHKEELPPESDDTTKVQSIIGSGTHNYLDYLTRKFAMRHADKYDLRTEVRLWDKFLDRKVSGQFDGWLNGLLYDYKITKTWKLIFGDYEDYEQQLNLYNYLCTLQGLPVDKMAIIAVLKDWQAGKATGFGAQKDYPKLNYQAIPIPQWDHDIQEQFLFSRLQNLIDHENALDEELPDCESKEMWEKPAKVAVMEAGKKKAARLCDSEEDAESYVKWRKDHNKPLKKYKLEHRKGSRLRCEKYCRVRDWCQQWKEWAKDNGIVS